MTKTQIREALETIQSAIIIKYGKGEPDREGCHLQVNATTIELIGYDSEVMVSGATPAIIADMLTPDGFMPNGLDQSAGPEIRDMQANGLDS